MGFSGDINIARARALEASPKQPAAIEALIPKGGATLFFDSMAIPKDAPHPKNAHLFINYMLRPEVIAAVTNTVKYPNGNAQATQYVDKEVLADPSVYPPQEVKVKLVPDLADTEETTKLMTRGWQKFTTGH